MTPRRGRRGVTVPGRRARTATVDRMRAAVITGQSEPLRLDTLDDPRPGPGELVLRVEACGICGSDLHLVDAFPMPGLVAGHEYCGEVVAVGSGVTGWREGDRATGLSLAPCGACPACRSGAIAHCSAPRFYGADLPGAFAEYVGLAADHAFRLPADLDARLGALVEPLAVARHIVDRSGATPGDTVLVLGAGPVGQAVLLWLAHRGIEAVVVSDPVASRRELAGRLGAALTVDPTAANVAAAVQETTGVLPGVVIECVGQPGMIAASVAFAGARATVAVAGVCMMPDTFSPLAATTKELDLRFAVYYRREDFAATIRAVTDGAIDPLPLVTDEIGLDELPARFDALRHPTHECKVLVRP